MFVFSGSIQIIQGSIIFLLHPCCCSLFYIQILEATRKAKVRGVSNKVTFIHGKYALLTLVHRLTLTCLSVPRLESVHNYFAMGSFDAIYSIESLRVFDTILLSLQHVIDLTNRVCPT
jgi:hypothetical protein